MLPKGILFDLDDTIIASSPAVESTWRHVCEVFADKSGLFEADKLFTVIRQISN